MSYEISRSWFLSAALALLPGCPASEPEGEPAACDGEILFGSPNDKTGLDASQCQPTCEDCAGAPWGPPTYTASEIATWRVWLVANATVPPLADPYAEATAPVEPGENAVCGVLLGNDGTYTLEDYEATSAALSAGALVTHYGTCGTCSTLTDLAVYAEISDLTEPVRACGLEHLDGDQAALTACIAALGFTEACASTWAWNTLHTRDVCLDVCLADLDAPYNNADGTLNDCLQCDEDESGAVFKAVAGRTRRNTGLASAICRPCSDVKPLVHAY